MEYIQWSLTYLLALGYVPKELKTNLEKLNLDETEVKTITRKLQTISFSGTVKIVKTFVGFIV